MGAAPAQARANPSVMPEKPVLLPTCHTSPKAQPGRKKQRASRTGRRAGGVSSQPCTASRHRARWALPSISPLVSRFTAKPASAADSIRNATRSARVRFMKTASFFISTSLSAQTVILFPVLQIFPEIIIFLKFMLDILLPLGKISIRLEV